MTDLEIAALCGLQEAGNQPDEGVAAVVQVILDRVHLGYQCDRTIQSAVERPAAFSWTQYEMVDHDYENVAPSWPAELARIQQLLIQDEAMRVQWARCTAIAASVIAGSFRGPLFNKLTTHTVLYANLSICKPSWAPSSRPIVKIGAQTFFEPDNLGPGAPVVAPVSPGAPIATETTTTTCTPPPSNTVSIEI